MQTMTGKRRLGVVAAAATLLAAAPLSVIFLKYTWLFQCALAVGLCAGAVTLARSLRAPVWAQLLSQITALLFALTWMFPGSEGLGGLIPTTDTFANFGRLMAEAGNDTRTKSVPVDDVSSLLFLAVLGIGAVGILVDLLTVTLRRPALAGLPMLAIYSVPVAVLFDSVPVAPFAISASGYIWLLVADNVDRVRRFGRRFTGDGKDVDVWEPSPLAAAGRRLAVVGVAAAILLPLAVPGLTNGLLSQFIEGSGGGIGQGSGGLNGSVNLFANLGGTLKQSDAVEMVKVRTTEQQPYYLRFAVADQLTPTGFQDRTPGGARLNGGSIEAPTASGGGVTRERYTATVQLTKQYPMRMAPIFSQLTAAREFGDNWLYDPQALVLHALRERPRERTYTIDYVRSRYTDAALRRAESLPAGNEIQREFAGKPPAEPDVTNLVGQLTRGKNTPHDKVLAIYNHFKTPGFTYSTSVPDAKDSSQIAAFLRNKQGFCQQYAATMAWLVREAGLPARVAIGFTLGRRDGDQWVMTNKNLHAWTEVYYEGYGWVPYDATPQTGLTGGVLPEWLPDPNAPASPSASAGPSSSADTSGATPSTDAADRLDRERALDAAAAPGADTPTGPSWQTVATIAGGALLLALLAVPALVRRLVRRRRHAATEATPTVTTAPVDDPRGLVVTTATAVRHRRDAHAAWDELVDTMVDFGVPVDPTETPRVTAERLVRDATLTGPAATGAGLLGTAEERARYARTPLQGAELTQALTQVRKGVRARSTRRTRLRATLLPPSVTLRWRLALGDLSARTMARLGHLRESALRFSPRRLLTHRIPR
jgi:transglutaminase-like putative cysteine protease